MTQAIVMNPFIVLGKEIIFMRNKYGYENLISPL